MDNTCENNYYHKNEIILIHIQKKNAYYSRCLRIFVQITGTEHGSFVLHEILMRAE